MKNESYKIIEKTKGSERSINLIPFFDSKRQVMWKHYKYDCCLNILGGYKLINMKLHSTSFFKKIKSYNNGSEYFLIDYYQEFLLVSLWNLD